MRNDLTAVKAVNAIANTNDEVQIVIDDDHPGSDKASYLPDLLDHLEGLRVTHSRRRLIQEQEGRCRSGSTGKFQSTGSSVVEFAGPTIAMRPETCSSNQPVNVAG